MGGGRPGGGRRAGGGGAARAGELLRQRRGLRAPAGPSGGDLRADNAEPRPEEERPRALDQDLLGGATARTPRGCRGSTSSRAPRRRWGAWARTTWTCSSATAPTWTPRLRKQYGR